MSSDITYSAFKVSPLVSDSNHSPRDEGEIHNVGRTCPSWDVLVVGGPVVVDLLTNTVVLNFTRCQRLGLQRTAKSSSCCSFDHLLDCYLSETMSVSQETWVWHLSRI